MVLARQVSELQAAATLPLAAASQHMGSTVTGTWLGRSQVWFTYCIVKPRLYSSTRVLEKLLDRLFE